ncbi:hypothetical protein MKX01_041402 [Papaver californicum]|nr:hypothetical protein MKX01_041402 [Papaver californicum]
MDINPYFDNSSLAKTFRFCRRGISIEKGTEIRWKKDKAEQQAIEERRTMKMEYELELVHKQCESLRRLIYNRRNEIIKNVPRFWLIAFLSHYALHHLLSEEDQKIFRFLNSVNVEETEDDEGVIFGYTITLNFDPYFENDSLTKTISYTVISDNPCPIKEYSNSHVNICVCNIQRKDGMVNMTTRNQQGFTDTGTSFFTWLSDLGCVAMETYDETTPVDLTMTCHVNLLCFCIEGCKLNETGFWPNAGRYFVNGNLNVEQKVDLVAIKKTAQSTSSLRTFFI